jgi:hypothetical protein
MISAGPRREPGRDARAHCEGREAVDDDLRAGDREVRLACLVRPRVGRRERAARDLDSRVEVAPERVAADHGRVADEVADGVAVVVRDRVAGDRRRAGDRVDAVARVVGDGGGCDEAVRVRQVDACPAVGAHRRALRRDVGAHGVDADPCVRRRGAERAAKGGVARIKAVDGGVARRDVVDRERRPRREQHQIGRRGGGGAAEGGELAGPVDREVGEGAGEVRVVRRGAEGEAAPAAARAGEGGEEDGRRGRAVHREGPALDAVHLALVVDVIANDEPDAGRELGRDARVDGEASEVVDDRLLEKDVVLVVARAGEEPLEVRRDAAADHLDAGLGRAGEGVELDGGAGAHAHHIGVVRGACRAVDPPAVVLEGARADRGGRGQVLSIQSVSRVALQRARRDRRARRVADVDAGPALNWNVQPVKTGSELST